MSTRFESIPKLMKDVDQNWVRRDCIFRGQSKQWALIPMIGRPEFRAILPEGDRIIEQFKKLYRAMYDGGSDHSDFRIHPENFYEWDWLALAQHYGLPTKMIDWSADIEVALYFAVEDRGYDDCDGAVYTFQDEPAIGREAPLNAIKNVRRYRAYRHPHFTDLRVKRQQGELTYQPDPTVDLIEQLRLDIGQKCEKVIIPKERKSDIRSFLREKQITHSRLFPGLAGICGEIRLEFAIKK